MKRILCRWMPLALLAALGAGCTAPAPEAPTAEAPPAASPAPPTVTPAPSAAPTPLHPEMSTLATDKRAASPVKGGVLYSVAGMDEVRLTNVEYANGLTMDLYYPPQYDFAAPLPAVIFVNGLPDGSWTSMMGAPWKEMERIISWAQLVAASGVIGISYETSGYAATDTSDAINFILKQGAWLGVDSERLCLWSASSSTPRMLFLLYDPDAAYQASLRCAVMYYGDTKLGVLPAHVPLLVVQAGIDDQSMNALMDELVKRGREAGATVEFIKYEQGGHGFDVGEDREETRTIIQRTLEFMLSNLTRP